MRPIILERDSFRCAVCSKEEKIMTYLRQGKAATRTNLTVHHIDEDVKNNRPDNLITMCQPCHIIHHKSAQTPFPELKNLAEGRSRSMTSKLKEQAISLQIIYSSTIV
ncbi:HNH endonuclease [Priestia megaterium]